MTKRMRTVLFIVCVVLFVLVAPSVIFYSQGYRFDFETRRVVQTGGIYLRASQRNAEIYLNGKLKDTTSIFTNSRLIENLLPKTYSVEIKKEGYHTWQKNLEVREKQVAEAKNVLLIRQNPDFSLVATSTKEIDNIVSIIEPSATSSDENRLIEFNDHEIWISFTEIRDDKVFRDSQEKVFLTRFSGIIGKIFWFGDYYLIFNVGNKIKIAETDDRDRLNIIDLVEFESPEIFWDGENNRLYVLSKGKLYLAENLLP